MITPYELKQLATSANVAEVEAIVLQMDAALQTAGRNGDFSAEVNTLAFSYASIKAAAKLYTDAGWGVRSDRATLRVFKYGE